jgi:hypothetical protein
MTLTIGRNRRTGIADTGGAESFRKANHSWYLDGRHAFALGLLEFILEPFFMDFAGTTLVHVVAGDRTSAGTVGAPTRSETSSAHSLNRSADSVGVAAPPIGEASTLVQA